MVPHCGFDLHFSGNENHKPLLSPVASGTEESSSSLGG